ncbi:MAG: YebC/PmpR family DNA-binding transcriptional regulator, partial [Kiritimatiellae bacterium]|nr:YebC/PmpR family DNA-binding transcriptional regulator [Kiritimatiellia bacterium]
FKKNNSDFAGLGAVSLGFERKGTIMVPAADGLTVDSLMEVALNAGADDMESEEGGFTVTCQPAAFSDVCAALETAGIKFDQENSQVGLVAQTLVPVTDVSVAKAVNKFVSALEEHDDVQDVYTNMDIDDAVAAQLDE